MNAKHIIMTRFLSRQMNLQGILQDDTINARLKVLESNLIPTLNNQTCQDFEFVLLVNPKASLNQIKRVKAVLEKSAKFKWKTQKHDNTLDDYIGGLWEGNDFVTITRIDDDDLVDRDCFKKVRDYVQGQVPGAGKQVTLCGYNIGFLYLGGQESVKCCNFGYSKNGHIGIFQTYVYDTKLVKYEQKLNPYQIPHDIAKKRLEDSGFTVESVSFDDKEGKRMDVLYFVHELSQSTIHGQEKSYKEILPKAEFSENLLKELKERFAFTPRKREVVKFKHVVLTKFLSKKMNLEDILEDKMIDYRLNILKTNLFETLNNQTNKNFELVLLTNPELQDEKLKKIKDYVGGIKHEFAFRTIPHDKSLDDYLGGLWKDNDFVVVSRIDDDDFADKDCVKRVQDFVSKMTPGGQEQVQVLGYNKGYMYIEWMQHLGKVDFGYGKNGHVGIFQTFVYDTKMVKYENKISPYMIGHELVRKMLNDAGCSAKVTSIDSSDGQPRVLFYLHSGSDSLYRATAKKHKLAVDPVDFTQETIDSLVSQFGFPKVQAPVLDEQLVDEQTTSVEKQNDEPKDQSTPNEEVQEVKRSAEDIVDEPVKVVDETPREFKWYSVPTNCLYGRIDNSLRNYHRLDLNNVPHSEEHMAKILHYAPGVSFVFTTKSKKLTLKYKAHYNKNTYNLPMKSLMEPMVLGLDEYGVWNMVNYIRVFTPEQEKGMRTDQELQFSVGGVDNRPAFDPMEYVKYQISFPTKATILEFAIGADLPVEFEKPGPVDLIFIGSSVAQDNYSSNHMNICPYLYREYGLNCATLGVSQYHTFKCSSLMKKISNLDIPCVLMDVLHISADVYASASKNIRKLNPFIIYKNREEVNSIIRQNGLGMQDLVVLPGDCMWDSVHINDYGTVFYCDKLAKRGLIPGVELDGDQQ